MKIIDTDALFEKYVKKYMAENAGKYTEEEWEDKIPVLYGNFGKNPLPELGGKSPERFYGDMNGEELCELLKAHVEEDVPVPDFLCAALVSADTENGLIEFLKRGTDEELTSYAVNILSDKACFRALPVYLDYVTAADTDENMRELMGEVLINYASDFKDELLKAAGKADFGVEYIAEALASCPRDDRIFFFLISRFEGAERKEVAFYTHLLAKYGDERAVETIKKRMAEPDVRYSDYTEMRYAVEALGGECTEERDFSSDPSYRKIKGRKN
ncbi:MAG: hypothetical protein J6Z34_01930 [Clostridia bacterium]|nr:hypothetical protein [Clostridia bacterium]